MSMTGAAWARDAEVEEEEEERKAKFQTSYGNSMLRQGGEGAMLVAGLLNVRRVRHMRGGDGGGQRPKEAAPV